MVSVLAFGVVVVVIEVMVPWVLPVILLLLALSFPSRVTHGNLSCT